MNLPPIIKQLDARLQGLPDMVLSSVLIGLSLIGVAVALWGSPSLKAALAAWFIAP